MPSESSNHCTEYSGLTRRAKFALHKSFVFSLAAPVFLSLEFFRFLFSDPNVYRVITLLSLVSGLVFLCAAAFHKPLNSRIWIFSFIILFLALFTSITARNSNGSTILFFFSHLGFAWALLHGQISSKIAFNQTCLLLGFFLVKIVVGKNPELVFVVSRNYISAIAIVAISLYFFACQVERKSPSTLLLMVVMMVLMWAIGRAGIISGIIILFGTLLISRKRFFAMLTFSLLLIAFYTLFLTDTYSKIESIQSFTVGIERFQRLSVDGQRVFINEEYIEAISSNPMSLLFGAPLDNVRAIREVDGNPHNSYISLHIFTGLLGVMAFIGLVFYSLTVLFRANLPLVALALVTVLFRSAFDSTSFQGLLDVPILYSIILAISGDARSRARIAN